jgi:hypothetical protein
MYYCHIPPSDYDNMGIKEISWHYNRLKRQKDEEKKYYEDFGKKSSSAQSPFVRHFGK